MLKSTKQKNGFVGRVAFCFQARGGGGGGGGVIWDVGATYLVYAKKMV